jgi:hypothetical protein
VNERDFEYITAAGEESGSFSIDPIRQFAFALSAIDRSIGSRVDQKIERRHYVLAHCIWVCNVEFLMRKKVDLCTFGPCGAE